MGTPGNSRNDRSADGMEALMENVMAEHEQALLRYAFTLVRDAHAAQDVVQNAFIKLFRLWKPGTEPGPALRAWLFRVTHNEAVDHIRREERRGRLHREQAEDDGAQADPPTEAERTQEVLRHVRRLDPAEQQVVLLRLQQGLSYKEISQATGRTEGNVGCLLHHAVRKLGEMLRRAESAAPVRLREAALSEGRVP